jgi:hypothetical protein
VQRRGAPHSRGEKRGSYSQGQRGAPWKPAEEREGLLTVGSRQRAADPIWCYGKTWASVSTATSCGGGPRPSGASGNDPQLSSTQAGAPCFCPNRLHTHRLLRTSALSLEVSRDMEQPACRSAWLPPTHSCDTREPECQKAPSPVLRVSTLLGGHPAPREENLGQGQHWRPADTHLLLFFLRDGFLSEVQDPFPK